MPKTAPEKLGLKPGHTGWAPGRPDALADALPDGWRLWRDWQTVIAPDNAAEIEAVDADRGRTLGYVRVVGRRTGARPDEPVTAVPTEYVRRPLLRGGG